MDDSTARSMVAKQYARAEEALVSDASYRAKLDAAEAEARETPGYFLARNIAAIAVEMEVCRQEQEGVR